MAQTTGCTNGVIIGKFMPPHTGHLHLIATAAAQVQHLYVLVCTLPTDPIPGYLRHYWTREMCRHLPNVLVLHHTAIVPSYPHEHPDFWPIWRDTILAHTAPAAIDVVFSSEDYGDELAQWLGAKHVCVDKARQQVPISATQIRVSPLQHWAYVPHIARHYFAKKVVLTGPESTGKSTLAEALAAHYDTNWLPEFGREYWEKYADPRGQLKLADISAIVGGHLWREELAARSCNGLLICDTDPMVSSIWSEIYFHEMPIWVQDLAQRLHYDLWLLMDTDQAWVNDGTREMPHLRQWHFDRIRQQLDVQQLPYVVLSGPYDTRLAQAEAAIKKHLGILRGSLANKV